MGRIGDSSGFCLLLGFSQEEYEKQKIMNAIILSRIQKRELQNIVLNVKAKNHSYGRIGVCIEYSSLSAHPLQIRIAAVIIGIHNFVFSMNIIGVKLFFSDGKQI